MAQLVVQFTVLYDLDLLYSDAGLCPRFFVCRLESHLKTRFPWLFQAIT